MSNRANLGVIEYEIDSVAPRGFLGLFTEPFQYETPAPPVILGSIFRLFPQHDDRKFPVHVGLRKFPVS